MRLRERGGERGGEQSWERGGEDSRAPNHALSTRGFPPELGSIKAVRVVSLGISSIPLTETRSHGFQGKDRSDPPLDKDPAQRCSPKRLVLIQ